MSLGANQKNNGNPTANSKIRAYESDPPMSMKAIGDKVNPQTINSQNTTRPKFAEAKRDPHAGHCISRLPFQNESFAWHIGQFMARLFDA